DLVYATSVVAPELRTVGRYCPRWTLYRGYMKNRLLPWQKHGQTFLLLNLPRLRPYANFGFLNLQLDRLGGWPQQGPCGDSPHMPAGGLIRNGMMFPEAFHVDPDADRALGRLL